MTEDDRRVRRRWFLIQLTRLGGFAGAVFGLAIVARTAAWPYQVLGIAIVLSALATIAIVPAALAHRWRTPG